MNVRTYRNEFTDWTVEYREGERSCVRHWDPREQGVIFPFADMWSEPFEPMTANEYERAVEAVWPVVREQLGVRALVNQIGNWAFVAMRWTLEDDGFLVNEIDHDVDYMELGRTLRLRAHAVRSGNDRVDDVVTLPREPRWHHPQGVPVTPEERARIRHRLETIERKNVWIGGALGYVVEDGD
jgi:hypothetical protein